MRRLIILLAITGLLALPVSALAADPTPAATPPAPVTISPLLPTFDPNNLTPESCAQLLGISLPAGSYTSGVWPGSGTINSTPPVSPPSPPATLAPVGTPGTSDLLTPVPSVGPANGSDLLTPVPSVGPANGSDLLTPVPSVGPVPSFDPNLATQCRALLGLSGDGLAPIPAPAPSPDASAGALSAGFCSQILGAPINEASPIGSGSTSSGSATSGGGPVGPAGVSVSGGASGSMMTQTPQAGNPPNMITIQDPAQSSPSADATTPADLAIVAQCQALAAQFGWNIGAQIASNWGGTNLMGQASGPRSAARSQWAFGYGPRSGTFGRGPGTRTSGSTSGLIGACPVGRPWWAYFWLAVALAGCFGAGYLAARARRLRRVVAQVPPVNPPTDPAPLAPPTPPAAGSGN